MSRPERAHIRTGSGAAAVATRGDWSACARSAGGDDAASIHRRADEDQRCGDEVDRVGSIASQTDAGEVSIPADAGTAAFQYGGHIYADRPANGSAAYR